jgi:hypothetical protein
MRNVDVTIYRFSCTRPRRSSSVLSGVALMLAQLSPHRMRAHGLTPRYTDACGTRAVDSFLAAVRRGTVSGCRALAGHEQLPAILRANRVVGTRVAPEPPMTVESLMAQDSTMTRAVAEWQVSKMRQYADSEPFAYLSHQFARVRTQRELFALTPDEAAARWIEAQDPRTAMRELATVGVQAAHSRRATARARAGIPGIVVADSLAYALFDREFVALAPLVERRSSSRATDAAGWRIAPQYGLLTGGAFASVGFSDGC